MSETITGAWTEGQWVTLPNAILRLNEPQLFQPKYARTLDFGLYAYPVLHAHLKIPTPFDRLQQRHFVGILDVHSDRNAIGNTRDPGSERF
jgi:hypothetical protein